MFFLHILSRLNLKGNKHMILTHHFGVCISGQTKPREPSTWLVNDPVEKESTLQPCTASGVFPLQTQLCQAASSCTYLVSGSVWKVAGTKSTKRNSRGELTKAAGSFSCWWPDHLKCVIKVNSLTLLCCAAQTFQHSDCANSSSVPVMLGRIYLPTVQKKNPLNEWITLDWWW